MKVVGLPNDDLAKIEDSVQGQLHFFLSKFRSLAELLQIIR